MEKKKIIIVVAIIALIIFSIFIINKKSKSKNNSVVNLDSSEKEVIADFEVIKNDIKQATKKCKEQYEYYGSKNFEIYFGINFINNYLENGEISFADIEVYDENMKIFDIYGDKLEEFPVQEKCEKRPYKIEKNKKYLVKYFSNKDYKMYYYEMTIDNSNIVNLSEFCFTQGEDYNRILESTMLMENN